MLNSLDCLLTSKSVRLQQSGAASLRYQKHTMQSLGRLHSSTHHTGVCSSRSSRGQAAVVPVPVQQHAAVAVPAAPAAALRHAEAPTAAWGAGSSSILQGGCVVPRLVSSSSSSSLQQVSQPRCCTSGLVKVCCAYGLLVHHACASLLMCMSATVHMQRLPHSAPRCLCSVCSPNCRPHTGAAVTVCGRAPCLTPSVPHCRVPSSHSTQMRR